MERGLLTGVGRTRSTTERLLLSVFVCLGMTAATLLWLIPALDNIKSAASRLALEQADRLRSNLELRLGNSLSDAQSTASAVVEEPDRMHLTLSRLLSDNGEFEEVAIADRSGKDYVRLRRDPGAPSPLLDRGHDSNFYLALQGTPNFWSGPLPQGESIVVLSVPVFDEGSVTGVITAHIQLSKVVTWGGIAGQGAAYVVDQDGVVVLSSDPARVPLRSSVEHRQIVETVIVDELRADGLAPGDMYRSPAGERMFAVGLPIGIAGWGVFVEKPASRAFAGSGVYILLACATWLLGMGIVLLVMRGNYRLGLLNAKLDAMLKENYEVGKILVRRDMELTEANNRLMALDENKSEFVSIAAHQLRTPLTGIRWSLSMLLDQEVGPLAPAQRKMIEEGLKSAVRMVELINSLLNVARIEEGRFGLALKPLPLRSVIDAAVARHTDAVQQKGVKLEYEPAAALPTLRLDEEKLGIALDNLLDNAVKYTSPGGTIALRASQEGTVVRVSVSDSGIGIPRSQMDKLFEKFFRADNALRFQTSGSGLGLYVVKNIIRAHGGSVRAESEENKGTTFTLELPAKVGS